MPITTLGKAYIHVYVQEKKMKHLVCVIKDDEFLEYEEIFGANFVRKNNITCDYRSKKVTIKKTNFKLLCYQTIMLKP